MSGCDLFLSDKARVEKARELTALGQYRTAIIELKKVLQNNAHNKDARMLLGRLSLATGEVVAAEKELRRAYKLGVPFDQVVIPLGQALLAQGKFDLVLEEFRPTVFESDDTKVAVLMLRGDAYVATGKLQDAERTFREVLARAPDSIGGRIGLAKAAQVAGDFDSAEAHLNDALQSDPKALMAWLAKGQLEFRRKRYAQAEEAFTTAIERGEPRANAVQEFIARNGLAETQWRQGESEAARGNVEKMARLAPRHPRPKYLRALIAYGAGDYKTTVEQLQEVLRWFPDYRSAQLLLGAAHYAKGNLEQADMYLSSVLAADPSSVQARKLLAATRLRQQQPNAALMTLQPAIAQGDTDQQLLGLASRAAFQAGDTDGGILYLEKGLKTDPDSAALQMELATGYLSSGDLEHAIEILEKLPETKEGAYRREVLLILAYLRKHDTKNALEEGRNVLAKRPNDPGAYNLVGSIYLVAGDLPKARQHFDMASQLQPDNLAVLMNLGRLDFREGKQDSARARFERVLRINPKNVNAMLALAQLSAARSDRQQVAQWLERASAVNPQDVDPRLLLVRHYLLAERDIAKAKELATGLAHDVPENAEVQNALGITQMAERDFQAAAASFRKTTRLAPKSGNFQYNLARAQLAQQNFGEAKRLLIKALELQPDHIPATSTLAMLEMRDGKTAQALARARNLQKSERTRAAGYGLEGDLQMMQRQYSKAVVAYDKAASHAASAAIAIKSYEARRRAKMQDAAKPLDDWLEKNPNDVRVRLALAQDYQKHGQLQRAITQYELLVRNNPNSARALNNLAWLYHETKDSRAIRTAERAYELQPESGAIADTLGWLLVEEGQVERGLALLRKAVEQTPTIPDIRYHLGVAFAKAGAKDEARKTLSELVNSGANFKDMAEAKRLLEQL